MANLGVFDAELRQESWFDTSVLLEGWWDFALPFEHDLIATLAAGLFTWQQLIDDKIRMIKINSFDNPEVPKLGFLDIFSASWSHQHFGKNLNVRGFVEYPEVNKLGYLDTFSGGWRTQDFGIKLDRRGMAEYPEVNKLGYSDIFSSAWNREDRIIIRRLISLDLNVFQFSIVTPFTWQQLTEDKTVIKRLLSVDLTVLQQPIVTPFIWQQLVEDKVVIRKLVTSDLTVLQFVTVVPFTWQQLIQDIINTKLPLSVETLTQIRELLIITPPVSWGWEPITLGAAKKFLASLDRISEFYRIEPVVVPIDWEVVKMFARYKLPITYDPSIRDLVFTLPSPPADTEFLIIKLGGRLYITTTGKIKYKL